MSTHEDKFNNLEEFVKEAIRAAERSERPRYQELLTFVTHLKERWGQLNQVQARLAELEQTKMELLQPPLQYGVFLGACPSPAGAEGTRDVDRQNQAEGRQVLVGYQGQRIESTVALGDGSKIDGLRQGQEVVLNNMLNIVGIRSEHLRGETAEVVNVLSPEGTARVLTTDKENQQLKVELPDAERRQVGGSPQLLSALARGDIVQLDDIRERAIAKVKPRLHVRSGGSEGFVAEISDQLFESGVDIGDLVRTDTRLQFAFEKLPSYETGGLSLEEVPDVRYWDIGGLDDQIEKIYDAIEMPYLYGALFDRYRIGRPKGILLYGPPGCGKTMVAKAIARGLTDRIREHMMLLEKRLEIFLGLTQEPNNPGWLHRFSEISNFGAHSATSALEARELTADEALAAMRTELARSEIHPEDTESALQRTRRVLRSDNGIQSFFLNVKGPELLNKYVGETEHRIRKIFEEAKRRATFFTPVVIFFDEMEALFRARGSGLSSDVEVTIVPQFLSEMDGVEPSENVILIGATNLPTMLDTAVMRPGRLDIKIKIDRPGRDASRAILALNLTPNLPLERPEVTWEGQPGNFAFKPHVVRQVLIQGGFYEKTLQETVIEALPSGCDLRGALSAGALDNIPIEDKRSLEKLADREHAAELLINQATAWLFDRGSYLEVITSAGRRQAFPLRDFVSGALLVSIVSRAKKAALKRDVASLARAEGSGIGIRDLREAIHDEFIENADQFAMERLEGETTLATPMQPREKVSSWQIYLAGNDQDPWTQEKVKIYRVGPRSSTGSADGSVVGSRHGSI